MVNKRTLLVAIGLIVIVGVGYFLASGEGLQGRLLGLKSGGSKINSTSTITDALAGFPDSPAGGQAIAAALPNTLQISLASSPTSRTIPAGQVDVVFNGIVFSCGTGQNCIVKSVSLQGLLDDSGNASSFSSTGVGQDHGTSLNSYVSSVKLQSPTGGIIGADTLIGANGKVAFSTDWTIPAGTSKIAYVVGNVAPSAYQHSDGENIAFAVMQGSDVEYRNPIMSSTRAKRASGTVNTAPTVYITTATGGSLTITEDPSTPKENIVLAGTNMQTMSVYDFETTSEAFTVKKLAINNRQNGVVLGDLGEYDNNVESVIISYTNSNGVLETKTSYLVDGNASFAGLDFFIPQDQARQLTVYANLSSMTFGSTAGEFIQLDLAFDNFEALGANSGATYKADKIDASVSASSDLDFGSITFHDGDEAFELDSAQSPIVPLGGSTTLIIDDSTGDNWNKLQVGTILCVDDDNNRSCNNEDIYIVMDWPSSGSGTEDIVTVLMVDDAGDNTYNDNDPVLYSFPGSGYLKSTNLMHVYESKPTVSLNASSPSGTRTGNGSDNVFVFDVRADQRGGINLRRGMAGDDENDPIETNASDADVSVTSSAGKVVDGAVGIEATFNETIGGVGPSSLGGDEDCFLLDEAYSAGRLDDYQYVSFWMNSSESDVTYDSLAIAFDDNSACVSGGDDQYILGSSDGSGTTFVNGVKLANGSGPIANGVADSWALVTVKIPTNLALSSSTYFGFSVEDGTTDWATTDQLRIDGVVFHNEALILDLASDYDFNNDETFGQTAYLREGGTIVAQGGIGFVSHSSAKVLFVPGGLNPSDPYNYDIGISAGQTKTFTLTLDSATLLDEDGGSDDPFSVSFDLGSSMEGVVTVGDFWWYETNLTAQWLGNVPNTTIYGNTLRY